MRQPRANGTQTQNPRDPVTAGCIHTIKFIEDRPWPSDRSNPAPLTGATSPKGPGYAEHVYVTLTDGRRAELQAWDIPAHSDGSAWLDGPFDPDHDWPRQVGLEIYVKDQRGRYFTQLTRQRYPDLETAKCGGNPGPHRSGSVAP
jgi:hypothetical protein